MMHKKYFLLLLSICVILFACIPQVSTSTPSVPTEVQVAVVSSSSVTVSWQSVSDANSYRIYYGTTSAASDTSINISSGTSYMVEGLSAGTTYYFRVSAVNSTGESARSDAVSVVTTCSIPSGVQTDVASSSSVTVSWNSVSGANSYRVYYGTTSDASDTSISISSETSYMVEELSAGTTYYFRVSAVGLAGESAKSDAVSVTTSSNAASGQYLRVASSATSYTLNELDNNTVFIMKYNPADTIINAEDTGYLTGTLSDSSAVLEKKCVKGFSEDDISGIYSNGIIRYDNRKAQEFNTNPPPAGELFGSVSAQKRSEYIQPYVAYSVGSTTRSFWVQNENDAWIQISATLRAAGTYCYVWIADGNYDNPSATKKDENITSTQAEEVASKFDTVYPKETAVFGSKYDSSDKRENLVDPADKISILVYDIGYDYSPSQTSGTFGFFWAKDMYTDACMQKYQYRSNETELFYVDSYFLDYVPDMMYSTLAHEFQHMLHFVHKNIEQNLESSTWFNEMLSMLCEDMMQSTLNVSDDESPKSRLPYFNYYYFAGITTWYTDNRVFVSYANAYAFGAYLVRNYGGAEFIHNLATNSTVDMESITTAIKAECGTDTCKEAFLKYGQALVYVDSAYVLSHPSFNKSVTGNVEGYSFTFSPIDLNSYKETDDTTTYTGPVIYSPFAAGEKSLYPWGFSVHRVGTYSGTVTLNLSPCNSNEIVYILVK